MSAHRTRARDRQLPAIQWAIIGAGAAAGLLSVAMAVRILLGDAAGEDTRGWWSVATTAPAAAAALVGLVVYVAAAVSRSPRTRTVCMWVAVAADVAASVWIGVDGVWAATGTWEVDTWVALGGSLAAAAVLTAPPIAAVKADRDYARARAGEDADLAAWLHVPASD